MSAFASLPILKTSDLSRIFYMQLESIRNSVICDDANNASLIYYKNLD